MVNSSNYTWYNNSFPQLAGTNLYGVPKIFPPAWNGKTDESSNKITEDDKKLICVKKSLGDDLTLAIYPVTTIRQYQPVNYEILIEHYFVNNGHSITIDEVKKIDKAVNLTSTTCIISTVGWLCTNVASTNAASAAEYIESIIPLFENLPDYDIVKKAPWVQDPDNSGQHLSYQSIYPYYNNGTIANDGAWQGTWTLDNMYDRLVSFYQYYINEIIKLPKFPTQITRMIVDGIKLDKLINTVTKTYTNSTWNTSKTWYIKVTLDSSANYGASNVVNYVTMIRNNQYKNVA